MQPIIPENAPCFGCVHFHGMTYTAPERDPETGLEYLVRPFVWSCAAYPEGIPRAILNGKPHDTPRRGQRGKLVFTPGKPEAAADNPAFPFPHPESA